MFDLPELCLIRDLLINYPDEESTPVERRSIERLFQKIIAEIKIKSDELKA